MLEFKKLHAEIYDSVIEARRGGQFKWAGETDEEALAAIPGPVGTVWAGESPNSTGIPGSVEVPAEYARLFAASPALLVACKLALDILIDRGIVAGRELLRKAIAQAEGE